MDTAAILAYLGDSTDVADVAVDQPGLHDIEREIEDELQQAVMPELALDFYTLHAAEAAALRSLLGGDLTDPIVVDTLAFQAGMEIFACLPPSWCWAGIVERQSMRDVIPLRGDYLKLFGENTDVNVERFAEPARAGELAQEITSAYLQAGPLLRYREVVESPNLAFRSGLWMLKAGVLSIAHQQSELTTDGAVDRINAWNAARGLYTH